MSPVTDVRPEEGLRERHRRRTAADLERVALTLFIERGFDAVTVDDIAAATDVSRRTFFRYFASKEDVLLADHPRRLAELRAALEARPSDEPALSALRCAILSMTGSYEQERERLLRRFTVMSQTPSLQARSLLRQRAWEEAVTEMVAARLGFEPAGDMRPAVVAATTLAAVRVAIGNWLAEGGGADLPKMVAEALDLLDGGLQAAAIPPPSPPSRPPKRPGKPAKPKP